MLSISKNAIDWTKKHSKFWDLKKISKFWYLKKSNVWDFQKIKCLRFSKKFKICLLKFRWFFQLIINFDIFKKVFSWIFEIFLETQFYNSPLNCPFSICTFECAARSAASSAVSRPDVPRRREIVSLSSVSSFSWSVTRFKIVSAFVRAKMVRSFSAEFSASYLAIILSTYNFTVKEAAKDFTEYFWIFFVWSGIYQER